MPEWLNFRNAHAAVRLVTAAYLAALFGWAIYKHYTQRRGRRSDGSLKRVDGDSIDDDVDAKSNATQSSNAESEESDFSDNVSENETAGETEDVVDIEDIETRKISTDGNQAVRKRTKGPIDYSAFTEKQLTDRLKGDLSKQGYRLVESHSAVKICRWTKNSMRGRGGCYKHTFYGIKSYQCMEMTPNLACASKCTFCWRHHKNPVGTEWKWKMDPPDLIVEQCLNNHYEMIRQLKGVPGVTKGRFSEAHQVRHCALSLVGEPIFYPRINELLEILHARKISTFLVTNAQFPDAMRHLVPVTQLYVSIDAPNKQALKKIDRPLYRDFWERYIECLEIIKNKKQRTVFRLTLVKKANMEDLEGYARLINIGQPDFIEIKGVTYCGTSKANKLTMENVPWHEQVVEFAKQLLGYLPNGIYELACEHSHSNCTLIANKKFKINDRWHTWINYERFFELIALQANNVSSSKEFSSLDYAAETPSWATFGSVEGGFDPEHLRWVRKDHKLRLRAERIASQNSCSSNNDNCCRQINAIPIEQES